MTSTLLLVVVAVAAYLAAHVLVEWLGRRFLVVSGAEYLLLGILLGPRVTGVLTPDVVTQFAPATTPVPESPPPAESPLDRPEVRIGIAFAGAFIDARVLKRIFD